MDSYGAATLPGLSLNQVDPERSNILTVAVSRARSALILVANLQYLDSKLPGQSYFRKILYQAQQHGRVIDVKEFLGDEEFNEYRDLLSKNINFAKKESRYRFCCFRCNGFGTIARRRERGTNTLAAFWYKQSITRGFNFTCCCCLP